MLPSLFCFKNRVAASQFNEITEENMSLSIGIVGLPNVGKSTLFNALTRAQNAQSANYPFCTIEPNLAAVPVPDFRLQKLAELVNPQRIINATVEFVDIAGLVKGASRGEGLGNKFLGNIREADAILHVIRCFDDSNVVHVEGSVDPVRDANIVETELILADLESLEKRIERLTKLARADKEIRKELDAVILLKDYVENGNPVISYPEHDAEELQSTLHDMRFLTDKRIIYVANVDEASLLEDNEHVAKLREYAASRSAQTVRICARIEEDMAGLPDDERNEFLSSYGIEESGLDVIVKSGYETLGLISYLTAGPLEVRAWTIHKGWKAPKAAGVIHTDFERGFIRAQVISYEDYIANGGEQQCKALGVVRMEGKDYVMQDGDVVEFLFNV